MSAMPDSNSNVGEDHGHNQNSEESSTIQPGNEESSSVEVSASPEELVPESTGGVKELSSAELTASLEKPVLESTGGIMSALNEPETFDIYSEIAETNESRQTTTAAAEESEDQPGATVDVPLDSQFAEPAISQQPGKKETEALPDYIGEYCWKSKDGTREAVLRLRPGGQWWHAAHQNASSNVDNGVEACAEVGTGAPGADAVKSSEIWEMAESLGCWHLDPGTGAIQLTCDHCKWSSDKLNEAPVYKPSKARMLEMDELIASGEIIFHYVLGRDPTTGRRRLDVQLEPMYRLPSEARMLGFSRGYHKTGLDANSKSPMLPSSEDFVLDTKQARQQGTDACTVS